MPRSATCLNTSRHHRPLPARRRLAADVLLAEAPDAAAAAVDEDVTWDDQAALGTTRLGTTRLGTIRYPLGPTTCRTTKFRITKRNRPLKSRHTIPVHPPRTAKSWRWTKRAKANLRRLETTLSWLESEVEACRLPPATPLPQIPGLPVVGPIIDRSTLDRTLHRAPPLPAWLREPPATRPPGPPPHSRVFWPRVAKFLVACAIAAPLSYFFAVMPSPLQKRLAEIAGMASLDSPVVRPPEPRHRFRMSRAGPELAPDAPSLAPALPTLVEVEPRSSPELRTTEAAVPTPAVPVQSAQAEGPQVEAPRIEALRDEAPRVRGG